VDYLVDNSKPKRGRPCKGETNKKLKITNDDVPKRIKILWTNAEHENFIRAIRSGGSIEL
jgi:hypothetical protein